jgi:hypothetical protein
MRGALAWRSQCFWDAVFIYNPQGLTNEGRELIWGCLSGLFWARVLDMSFLARPDILWLINQTEQN